MASVCSAAGPHGCTWWRNTSPTEPHSNAQESETLTSQNFVWKSRSFVSLGIIQEKEYSSQTESRKSDFLFLRKKQSKTTTHLSSHKVIPKAFTHQMTLTESNFDEVSVRNLVTYGLNFS